MCPQRTSFGDSLYLWIAVNRIFGLWPYYRSARVYIKYKYHFLITVQCFLTLALLIYSFDTLLQQKVDSKKLMYVGVLTIINNSLILSWVFLNAFNNDTLLQLFYLFDEFDDSLKIYTSKSIPFKKFYQFRCTNLLIVIYITEFLCFTFLMMIDTGRVIDAIVVSSLRFGCRLGQFSFVVLYSHILGSLKLRLTILKTTWHEMIVAKAHRPLLHAHISVKIDELKLLYYNLLNIIDHINIALGSRLAVLYTTTFYTACMYFYFMRSQNRFSAAIFLSYPLVIMIKITLLTQSVISASDFTTQLVALPMNKLPDRILLQVYQFLQQMRECPVYFSAAGFFHIDGKLLSSTLMALASYLVAIFQLAPVMNQFGTTIEHTI